MTSLAAKSLIKRFKREITADQIAALYYLTNGNSKMDLEFTESQSGGRHLYVTAGGQQYHVSQNGKLVKVLPE